MRSSANRDHLLRSLLNVSGSAIGVRVSAVIFGLVIRRLLGPQLIGIWNILEIAASYLAVLTVGFVYSLERLLPVYRRQSDDSEAKRHLEAVFTWNVGETAVVAAGVGGFLWLRGDAYDPTVRAALVFLPFLFAAQKLLSLYPMLLRSSKAFGTYAGTNLIVAQLDWLLIAWALWGGLTGLLLGSLVNAVIKLLYYGRVGRKLSLFSFDFRFDAHTLRAHLPYAPRHALFKGLFIVFERLDSLVVAYLLGPAGLGLYYLGYKLATAALELPNAVVYVAYPHLVESAAAGDRQHRAFAAELDTFVRVTLFAVLPITIALGYFGSEFVIRQFLPDFAAGITSAKLLMLAIGAQSLRQLYYRVFMVRAKLGLLTVLSTSYLLFFCASYWMVATAVTDTLVAVGVAALLAHTLNVAVLHFASNVLIGRTRFDRRGVMLLSQPVLWSLLVGFDLLVPGDMGGTFGAGTAEFLVRLAFVAVVIGAFLVMGFGRNFPQLALLARNFVKRDRGL